MISLCSLYQQIQVLTNGIEVKLQRNALSVIEAPTGNEEDDDLEFDNVQWNGSDMGEFILYRSNCFNVGIVFYLKTMSIMTNKQIYHFVFPPD